eukprot:scaffold7626_cov55-Phaeocystis_antarctica.AAC.4
MDVGKQLLLMNPRHMLGHLHRQHPAGARQPKPQRQVGRRHQPVGEFGDALDAIVGRDAQALRAQEGGVAAVAGTKFHNAGALQHAGEGLGQPEV